MSSTNMQNVSVLIMLYHLYTATTRVDGNKKGILTRQRQPKPAARLLRQRYHSLGLGVRTCFNPVLMGFSGHTFCTP